MLVKEAIEQIKEVTGREFGEVYPDFESMDNYGRQKFEDWTFVVEKRRKVLSFMSEDVEFEFPLRMIERIEKDDDGVVIVEFATLPGEHYTYIRLGKLAEGRSH